ncbi:MAG: hypothetical protein V1743_00560 [Nanoarchaeota archaeon]
MENPILKKLLAEGPDSMNLSALGSVVRHDLLTKAGDIFLKEGQYAHAARSYELAENNEKLALASNDFYRQYNFRLAALFLIPTKDKEKLEALGQVCVEKGQREAALQIFESLGDERMVNFIKENK